MVEPVRQAIHSGAAEELRRLLREDPALTHADVGYGDGSSNTAPPLHLVCDAVFRKLISEEQALALTDVLLDAKVDLEHRFAKSGDSYLISAASLGVETVGIRMVEQGADVSRVGLFGATALHWAAFMGLDRMAHALLAAGSDLELRDQEHQSTPLEWALHAWENGTNGRRERLPEVASVLVAAGARVPEDARSRARDNDDEMARALS